METKPTHAGHPYPSANNSGTIEQPDLHAGVKNPITLNYRQAVNLFGLLDTIQGEGLKTGVMLNAIGSIWESVGLQIGALEKDKYGEPVHVQDWKPEL